MSLEKLGLYKNPFFLNNKQIEWVRETLDSLTIEEKVGQLFTINSSGKKKNIKDLLKYKPGGVFLHMHLKRHQQKASNFLQENSSIPMLIAGDLEMGGFGGAINATAFCSQMGVGATDDSNMAYKFGLVVGREASAMGYNWTYSPLVDINYNFQNPLVNLRSFGDRPDLVLKMALSYIKGTRESGIAACAKHWPGDGMDDRDQHLTSTSNSMDINSWNNTFGKVWKGVIDAGILTIMSAHIYLPDYIRKRFPDIEDKDIKPASISYELNQKLLREELGFNGMIVSDATGMIGLTSHGKREDIVPMVIKNGCDMFLFAHGRKGDYMKMINGVDTGIITKQRLDEAVTRILATKAALKLPEKKADGSLIKNKSELKMVKCDEHRQWAVKTAKKSITLVKHQEGVLPLTLEKYPRILLVRGEDFGIITRRFKKYLGKKGFKIKNWKKGVNVSDYDAIIYLVTKIGIFAKNSIRVEFKKIGGMHWYSEDKPCIFISMGSPYLLYEIPRMKTFINTYNPFLFTQKILVEKLVGNEEFEGKNPIDPFCGLFDAKL